MDESNVAEQPGDLAEFVTALQTTPQMRNYIEACSQSKAKVPIFDENGDCNILSLFFTAVIKGTLLVNIFVLIPYTKFGQSRSVK